MELIDEDDDGATVTAGLTSEAFRLRSYQAEMVDASLQANIIVAMDTGSGKTHIALASTAATLETCNPNKMAWFLTPTVALCEQQFRVFQSNMPGYGIQVLSGKDDVDHWTDQSIWDAVLDGVRIVLSTHQVLLDALTHGFVKMSKLALIIFDEAHHCTLKHPANLILVNFYTSKFQNGNESQLPRILGLSASPVMKAKASAAALLQIEENMCATTKTPKIHRSEMLRFVHRPQLLRIGYPPALLTSSPLLSALKQEHSQYDLMKDPYVIDLLAKQSQGYDTSRQLQKVFLSGNTYCSEQLKTLFAKSKAMAEELGVSAAEWYLSICVRDFQGKISSSDQQLLEWSHEERQHLSRLLQRLPVQEAPYSSSQILDSIAPKVEALVETLIAEASSSFTGLVFVEQRVWVTALAEILSLHPRTRGVFNIGTFVGTSQSSKRKTSIANFAEPPNQQDTLDKFRAGEIDLIIATSVLEEGIDVSSCHLVICFERPKNLKSFIQRRGRARKQQSKYYIFLPDSGTTRAPETWEALENEMVSAYNEDLRQVELAEERELSEEDGERLYQVPSTGALLTLDNASQHLHHFCSVVSSGAYVDPRPQFRFEELETSRVTAEVVLPLCVDPAVRTAKSLESWKTERLAMKDAAFQAYTALHQAGLVNDNLLPSRQEADEQTAEFHISDNTPSLVEASSILDPWLAVAEYDHLPESYHCTHLELTGATEEPFYMVLLTPIAILTIPPLTLYFNETKRLSVQSSVLPKVKFTGKEIEVIRAITGTILTSIFRARMQERDDFLWLLVPSDNLGLIANRSALLDWSARMQGCQRVSSLSQQHFHDISKWGQVSVEGEQRKYIPKAIISNSSNFSVSTQPCLHATRVPKRRDFLHPLAEHNHVNDAYTRIEELDISKCLVDNLPAIYSIFAMLAPSIVSRIEAFMIADQLRTTLLAPLSLDSAHLPLLLQALTSSATGEKANYQRLEFLGDCILKFIASVHLMADHLTWPESFLTSKKSKIVSNGFAARATLAAGLDKFIFTKRFTGSKWAPRYIRDITPSTSSSQKRTLSSKVLADVVESLIGASYIIGGFPKAFTCIQTLLPLETWTPIPDANTILFSVASTTLTITSLTSVETLIAYPFQKKTLLLEALTHASYTGPLANCSYERLEFLGDAVLDYIISKQLYSHVPELSHQKMHAVRTAMANAAFLSFRMFETTTPEERTNPSTMQKETHDRCLWQYLRSSSHQLVSSRDAAVKQHEAAKEQILHALQHEQRFPWHLLSLTDSPKFLSDIVESVIGAIYIDSHGDISTCEIFVRRLGILDCLERILRDEVDCLHPKERLGHLAVERDVQYVKVANGEDEKNGSKGRMYKVQVKVGGENVGGVVEGLKRLNAETIAAWKAVGIMEGGGEREMEDVEEWFDAEEGGGVAIEVE